MRELGYILKYLDKQRFESLVFLSRGGDLFQEYEQYANVYTFKDYKSKSAASNLTGTGSRRFDILAEFLEYKRERQATRQEWHRLYELVKSFGPDLLVWHYHFPIPLFDSLDKLGLPGIQHVQQRYAALAAMPERELSRFLGRGQDYVCEGSGVHDELHTFAGVPLEKIHVIPMSFDPAHLAENSDNPAQVTRAELGISENAILVGTVGSILYVKAPDLLLKAAEHIKSHYADRDIQFLWLGGLPYMFKTALGTSITALASEYGVAESVHFIGDRQNVYPYLQLLDIYAHPARFDAFPRAVIEAMAMKLPAVTFRQGLAEEDFAQESMLVAENFDPIALAQAIVRLADSPSLRQELGQRGAKLVRARYDAKTNIPMYESLLEQVAQRAQAKL